MNVTELGLGAWPIGGTGATMDYGDIEDGQAVSVLESYVEHGGNFIDTARGYNDSERRIGLFLSQFKKREDLIIATKSVAGKVSETVPEIEKDLETSLRFLKTDYVDILQLHQPPADPEVMHRALDVLVKLKEQGKIRATGASIKGPNVTEETGPLCHQYIETGKIDTIQVVYSILRQRLSEAIAQANEVGVGVITRTALESGLLTGEHSLGETFTGSDQRSRYEPPKLEFILKTVQELRDVVQSPYTKLSQLALRFALSHPGISTTIVGMDSIETIEQNVAALKLPPLDDSLIAQLEEEYGQITDQANYF
jgi:aryl-alcohol dehydrogenase-like predicted oxidoreductase